MQPQLPLKPANSTWYLFGDTLQGPFADILVRHAYSLPWPAVEPLPVLGIGAALSGVAFHTHGAAFAQSLIGFKRWYLSPPSTDGHPPPCFKGDEAALDWALQFDSGLVTPVLIAANLSTANRPNSAEVSITASPAALLLSAATRPATKGSWRAVNAYAAASAWACTAGAGKQLQNCSTPVSHDSSRAVGPGIVAECSCFSGGAVDWQGQGGHPPDKRWQVAWKWRQVDKFFSNTTLASAVKKALLKGPPSAQAQAAVWVTCVAATAEVEEGGGVCAPLQCSNYLQSVQKWYDGLTSSPRSCSNDQVAACTVPEGWFLHVPSHWWHSTLNVAPYNAFATVFVR